MSVGDEESVEEATLLLQRYKLAPDLIPGYELDAQQADTTEIRVLEDPASENADPAGIARLFAPHQQAGRVVSVQQRFGKQGDTTGDGPRLSFTVTLYGSPAGATQALRTWGNIDEASSDYVLSRIDVPPLGEEAHGVRNDLHEDGKLTFRIDQAFWRRGRLLLQLDLDAFTADEIAAETSTWWETARRADAFLATLPTTPPRVNPPAAFMPSSVERFTLYRTLSRLLPADDAYPGFQLWGLDTMSNPELINDARLIATGPLADSRALAERLLRSERRILGVSKEFRPVEGAANPPGTRFPDVSLAFHLYADGAGAAEAFNASPEELLLRVREEIPIAITAMTASPAPLTPGERATMLRGRYTFTDGIEVEVASLRWLRGSVELATNVIVGGGQDPLELLVRLAREHDARYTAAPLPGTATSPMPVPSPSAPAPSPAQTPRGPAPVQIPR